jgi:predicted flap endonuclease-1-like 5' DNA nuclease
MTWLLSQIWLALGLAALIGVIIGWFLHIGRAAGARKQLNADLEAARQQADGHYSNFNRVSAEANSLRRDLEESRQRAESLTMQQSSLVETRTSALEAELAAARAIANNKAAEAANLSADVEALKQKIASATETAAVVAPVQATLNSQAAEGEDAASLRWRNRYLESRVRFLESRVSGTPSLEATQSAENEYKAKIALLETSLSEATAKAEAAAAQASAPAPIPEPVAAVEAAPAAASEDTAKLEWKARYLEARVTYLQSKLDQAIESSVATPAVAVASLTEAASEPAAEATPETGEDTSIETSKLRWQNRYLEARLRYFEGLQAKTAEAVPETVAVAVDTSELDGLRARVVSLESEANAAAILRLKLAELEAAPANAADEQEASRLKWRARYLEGRVKYLESLAFPAAAAATEPVAEAIAETVAPEEQQPEEQQQPEAPTAEPESTATVADREPSDLEANTSRPLALDGPREGRPDDLKMIGGVGPKIEATLHELGIYHFDQVASWTAAEAAWVDSYLRFTGRIEREEWIEQAKALAAGETTDAAQKYLDGEQT